MLPSDGVLAVKRDINSLNVSNHVYLSFEVNRLGGENNAWLAPTSWRALRTVMTDKALESHGLEIINSASGAIITPKAANSIDSSTCLETEKSLAQLGERFAELSEIAEEEDLPLSSASMDAAREFASARSNLICPSAFLLGNGNIRLVWEDETGRQVGLQFRSADDIQFILLKRRNEKIANVMGSDNAEGVLATIAAVALLDLVERC